MPFLGGYVSFLEALEGIKFETLDFLISLRASELSKHAFLLVNKIHRSPVRSDRYILRAGKHPGFRRGKASANRGFCGLLC